jgi:Na+/proline symporter
VFRHRFDPSSVVAAVLFLGLAGLYLADGLDRTRVSFLWAVPAVLAGLLLIGILRMASRSRRRS